MFEQLRLSGSVRRYIALETRLRTPLENSQALKPEARSIRIFELQLRNHPRWELRKASCGVYNCFGHVWASRRTALYYQKDVEAIFRDDGYRRLQAHEKPFQGDLAVYYDRSEQSIYHVGIVGELRRLVLTTGTDLAAPIPWVLSKWNDASGEVLHHINDVPFEGVQFTVRFWTDRPILRL